MRWKFFNSSWLSLRCEITFVIFVLVNQNTTEGIFFHLNFESEMKTKLWKKKILYLWRLIVYYDICREKKRSWILPKHETVWRVLAPVSRALRKIDTDFATSFLILDSSRYGLWIIRKISNLKDEKISSEKWENIWICRLSFVDYFHTAIELFFIQISTNKSKSRFSEVLSIHFSALESMIECRKIK